MSDMPVFAREFGYTPAEFRAIRILDYGRLTRNLTETAASRAAMLDRVRRRREERR